MPFDPSSILGPNGEHIDELAKELAEGVDDAPAPPGAYESPVSVPPVEGLEDPPTGGGSHPGIEVPTQFPHDFPGEDPGLTPINGGARAAIFISDLHISDGGIGDDFRDGHLFAGAGGLYQGNPTPGPTRGLRAAAAIQFAIQEAANAGVHQVDLVLNGDIIDLCELMGRKSKLSAVHNPFWTYIRQVAAKHNVYYIRGNHDFLVPPGPWTRGVAYENLALTTFAEHGDAWDGSNWPPGPNNTGSKLLIGPMIGPMGAVVPFGLAELEEALTPGTLTYDFAAIDNLVPFSGAAVSAFLERRAAAFKSFANVATGGLGALIGGVGLDVVQGLVKLGVGPASDKGGRAGAAWRRRAGKHAGWLMVQGHTHVPVQLNGRYYNTGTWNPVVGGTAHGPEWLVEAYPLLLVYLTPNGRRVEVFRNFNVLPNGLMLTARLRRQDTNRLREMCGYERC